jgi:hypothetical protein
MAKKSTNPFEEGKEGEVPGDVPEGEKVTEVEEKDVKGEEEQESTRGPAAVAGAVQTPDERMRAVLYRASVPPGDLDRVLAELKSVLES